MTERASEALIKLLRTHPRAGGSELCTRLGGISRATFMRLIRSVGDDIVIGGRARRTRYSLRRPLAGKLTPIPIYRIDEVGIGHELGELSLTYPEGSVLSAPGTFPWPLDRDMNDGWFDGVPYPLLDMRPQGFLGRNFAYHHALDLGVPDNPEAWSDDDTVFVLMMTGYDQPGDLILGETAYRRFLDHRRQDDSPFMQEDALATEYPRLAEQAIAHGEGGSSAGGEFPKFTARLDLAGKRVSVIVKFSGGDDSPAVRRWADLLVCEHLAHKVMAQTLNLPTVQSTIRHYAGRTFLEVTRFDRHGDFGRSGVCTLGSLNAALVGTAVLGWTKTAMALQVAGSGVTDETISMIRRIGWFGKHIGNTDMHEGNLAFRPDMTLAPVYDMLPMSYAPHRGGELPAKVYAPELPLPEEMPSWCQAAHAGVVYWQTCAGDERISSEFRVICEANASRLIRLQASAGA